MKLPVPIAFDWDHGNIDKNQEKHKVHFKEAEEIFFINPLKIFPDKQHSEKESRFVAYGITNNFRKLIVIFTIRDSKIRVISARNQNKKERSQYEKK